MKLSYIGLLSVLSLSFSTANAASFQPGETNTWEANTPQSIQSVLMSSPTEAVAPLIKLATARVLTNSGGAALQSFRVARTVFNWNGGILVCPVGQRAVHSFIKTETTYMFSDGSGGGQTEPYDIPREPYCK